MFIYNLLEVLKCYELLIFVDKQIKMYEIMFYIQLLF